MKAHYPRAVPSIKVDTAKILKLERSGRYEAALDEFGDGWADEAYIPDTSGLSAREAYRVLLRFGALIGFYAFKHQVANDQERSKDILTVARRGFETIDDLEGVAECDCYIALAYWRSFEYQEAFAWAETMLAAPIAPTGWPSLYGSVTKSLILLSQKRYAENIEFCLSVEKRMREYGDPFLNGSLSTNIGLSYKNLGDTSSAMEYLTLARYFHERSGHKPYLGTVQNNLAQLHKAEGRFHLAHECADAGIKTYRSIKDRAREASTLDTKAQIYLAECRYDEAEKAASSSILILQKARNTAFRAESLMTRSTVRLRTDNIPGALDDLIEAVNITRQLNGERSADPLIADFAEELKRCAELPAADVSISGAELELVLPSPLSHYSDYKGLRINTPALEHLGIVQGSLAVVTPVKPKRGDLVAVSEKTGGAISCGTYDYEFGIVCLDRGDGEPLLFDENDVEILGKIIGYCERLDAGGKMQVIPMA